MDEDLYRTPCSDLTALGERRGSALQAILIAVLVNFTVTTFIGVVITVVYGVNLAANGDSHEVIATKLSSLDLTSGISLAILTSGYLVTIFAGYLCVKLANHSEYKIAAIYGVIMVVLGLFMGLTYYSIGESIILGFVTLCCTYLGAWIYVSKKTIG